MLLQRRLKILPTPASAIWRVLLFSSPMMTPDIVLVDVMSILAVSIIVRGTMSWTMEGSKMMPLRRNSRLIRTHGGMHFEKAHMHRTSQPSFKTVKQGKWAISTIRRSVKGKRAFGDVVYLIRFLHPSHIQMHSCHRSNLQHCGNARSLNRWT